MNTLLKETFAEVEKLSDAQQQEIAAVLRQELKDRLWDASFANSQELLAKMAKEALADLDAGRTEPLSPEDA